MIREIIHRGAQIRRPHEHRGRAGVLPRLPVPGQTPFAKDVMYIYNEGIAKQIMDLLEIDAQGGRLFEHPTEPTGEWDWI